MKTLIGISIRYRQSEHARWWQLRVKPDSVIFILLQTFLKRAHSYVTFLKLVELTMHQTSTMQYLDSIVNPTHYAYVECLPFAFVHASDVM